MIDFKTNFIKKKKKLQNFVWFINMACKVLTYRYQFKFVILCKKLHVFIRILHNIMIQLFVFLCQRSLLT